MKVSIRLCVCALLAVVEATGCYGDVPIGATEADTAVPDTSSAPLPALNPPDEVAGEPVLRRLTSSQYRNIIADWFGDELAPPATLESDARSEGLYAVGASVNGLSSLGVERYFNGAKFVASQLVELATLRADLVDCVGLTDTACLEALVDTWGLRLWRRPVTPAERARLLGVGEEATAALGSVDEGLRYILTALFASPHFLYVIGVGEESDTATRPYTSWEMASRLALFLWSSGPDDALLSSAAAGELTDPERLGEVVDEMLADPRARRGVRAFSDDWLELDGLTELSKDPSAFTYFSPGLGPQAREETLAVIEHLAFDVDADFRELLTTRTTFVNRRLAALYGVPSMAVDGFAQITLPEDGPRAGLLGHVSLLALHASPNRSSPTLRGLFIRERLLCQDMPSPPANVDTTIPEGSADAPTMRERLEVHLETPACAGCHSLTDLIGLGLERFDGLGGFRTLENEALIDPSGELDSAPFDDARGLGVALSEHPALVPCIVQTLWTYANGRAHAPDDEAVLEALVARFDAAGFRLKPLLKDVALSDGFRRVGPVEEAP
jgi:hypothetical protein